MAQPIIDPATGQIIGMSEDPAGSPWDSISALQAAAINQPPAPTKEEQDLMAQMNKMQMERIARQSQLVDQSQGRLDLLRQQPTQVDISPLLGLADAWTGSRLSQSYQKPETALQRQERLMGIENQVANQRDKVTDDQQRLLEANLRDKLGTIRAKSQDSVLRARLAQMQGGKPVPANLAADLGGANASVQALQDAQSLITQNQDIAGPAAGRVSSMLGWAQVGDRGKRAAILNAELKSRAQIIGKYLESGKLTDADIERYIAQLPGLNDDPQVAEAKIKNLQRLIAAKQQAELAGLSQAGYNTAGIQGSQAPALRQGKPAAAAPKRDYHQMSDAELEAALKGN